MGDSVDQWMLDLRGEIEVECMCVLQGKSLAKETADLVFEVPTSTKDHVQVIHRTMTPIKSEMKKLLRFVETEKWESVKNTAQKLTKQIQSQVSRCQSSLRVAPSHLVQHIHSTIQDCFQLTQQVDNSVKSKELEKEMLTQSLVSLQQKLRMLVDDTLSVLVKNILDNCARLCRHLRKDRKSVSGAKGLMNGHNETNTHVGVQLSDNTSSDRGFLIDALSDIIIIGLLSNYMCSLLAKAGGIVTLLEICRSPSLSFAHSEALRALATVCCVSESIDRLEQSGGIGCLTDILANNGVPESVRLEAAGVIAQVTSPTLATSGLQMGFMENLPELVRSLTDLCQKTSNNNTFLISCAALANMTSIDSMTCDCLTLCNVSAILIESCLKDKASSVFAREQVVTIIDNMASVESCHKDLTMDQRLLELLVSFLSEHPRSGATAMELMARERILRKAASAIGQLCRHRNVAVTFVKLKCVHCLVLLCKDPVLRNQNDEVLTSSLAALHKIFSVCGPSHELLKDEEEASRLVTSRIIDSYVLCTSSNDTCI